MSDDVQMHPGWPQASETAPAYENPFTAMPHAPTFHPDSTLKPTHISVHLDYDGSVTIEHHAQLVGPDGKEHGFGSGHGERFGPNEWDTLSLREMVARAHFAHYARLGLNAPAADDPALTPLHLHPKGHPAFPGKEKFKRTGSLDIAALRDHIIRSKEAELNGQHAPDARPAQPVRLDPAAHPLSTALGAAQSPAAPAPLARPASLNPATSIFARRRP